MQDVRTKTRVFISYSRADLVFARRLRDFLIAADFDAYLDVHDIVKGEPWQERLRSLIKRADAVVFLISPDSVASSVCEWEVNEAELFEKRLFPVVARATATDAIPQRLQRLNFTFLDSEPKWNDEGPSLLSALNEDITWVREHTRLGELAQRWKRAGRPGRQLLRGSDLVAAERWRDRRPPKAPALSIQQIDYLNGSRAGVQQRLRRWLSGAAALSAFAIGLSVFAYWQRDLAVRNGAVAEHRAAALATDVALTRADEGAVNQSLLMLLDASTRYEPTAVPEKLLLGLRDVARKSKAQRAFWFSSNSRAFHLPDSIAVFDPVAGSVFLINPSDGELRTVARYQGEVLAALKTPEGLVFISDELRLFIVATDQDGTSKPRQLASLQPKPGKQAHDRLFPTLQLSDDGQLYGQQLTREMGSGDILTQLWRYRPASAEIERFRIPDGLGDPVRLSNSTAYFWNDRLQSMQRLQLGENKPVKVSVKEAVKLGLPPCSQVQGTQSESHIQALYTALKPGLEQVRCAGVYGKLALISSTRALARSTMDEYFLFPAGATAASARSEYWLQNAVERLGSLGDMDPFAWFAGSAQAGLVAVSHADRILLLALGDGRYLDSSLYPDGDMVAREIATPDLTHGGRFHGATHFSYSGPDGDQYRVTVTNLSDPRDRDTGAIIETVPERAYWGSCGVQDRTQGDAEGVKERHFSVHRENGGPSTISFDNREVKVAAPDLKCASASQRARMLAVVDATGVALYSLESTDTQADASSSAVARIEDPSIETVSFLGEKHETLITTHAYKVTAWRAEKDGAYQAETVYRSKDRTMFAEGAPSGQRMLVWRGLGQADAMVHVVAVPAGPTDWLSDGPHWLVSKPDVFFDIEGAVYRIEDHMTGLLMPPVSLSQLRIDALSALSPSCRPASEADYRSSPCWPAAF